MNRHWLVTYTEWGHGMQQVGSGTVVKMYKSREAAELFAAEWVSKNGGYLAIYESVRFFKREENVVGCDPLMPEVT